MSKSNCKILIKKNIDGKAKIGEELLVRKGYAKYLLANKFAMLIIAKSKPTIRLMKHMEKSIEKIKETKKIIIDRGGELGLLRSGVHAHEIMNTLKSQMNLSLDQFEIELPHLVKEPIKLILDINFMQKTIHKIELQIK